MREGDQYARVEVLSLRVRQVLARRLAGGRVVWPADHEEQKPSRGQADQAWVVVERVK